MSGSAGIVVYHDTDGELPFLVRITDANGHVTDVHLGDEAAFDLAALLVPRANLARYGLVRMVQGACLGILAAYWLARVLA